jgi:hypothetical protein
MGVTTTVTDTTTAFISRETSQHQFVQPTADFQAHRIK